MSGRFGALSELVQPCVYRGRSLFASLIGGPGSGKTYSALTIAFELARPHGGMVVLVSSGESQAETLYAHLGSFHHIDLSDQRVIDRVKAAGSRWNFSLDGEGIDPRVALYVVEQIIPGLGRNDVLVFDSISTVWKGVIDRVDRLIPTLRGAEKARQGQAWQTVGEVFRLLWERFKTAKCNRLITVRAKTEASTEGSGRDRITYHTPTEPVLKRDMRFDPDVRIWIRSDHVAEFKGRLTSLNNRGRTRITPAVADDIATLLADPTTQIADQSNPSMSGGDPNCVPEHNPINESRTEGQ